MEGTIHRIVSAVALPAISRGHKVDPTVGLDIVQPRQIADRDEEWNCGVPAYGRKLQFCSCPA